MTKNKKNLRFFGEIQRLQNGKFKVKFMQRLVGVNQHRRKWVDVDCKEFSNMLSTNLVTK